MYLLRFSVDFNGRDEDGSVRLTWNDEIETLDGDVASLRQGVEVYITDGELGAVGDVDKRDGIWVVVIREWLPPLED